MSTSVILSTPSADVDLNLAGASGVAVMSYKFWTAPAASGPWTLLASGTTPPNQGFHKTFTAPSGSALGYWIGIVTIKPSMPYAAVLTFSQNGTHLQGGTISLNGDSDASNSDIHQDSVNFV